MLRPGHRRGCAGWPGPATTGGVAVEHGDEGPRQPTAPAPGTHPLGPVPGNRRAVPVRARVTTWATRTGSRLWNSPPRAAPRRPAPCTALGWPPASSGVSAGGRGRGRRTATGRRGRSRAPIPPGPALWATTSRTKPTSSSTCSMTSSMSTPVEHTGGTLGAELQRRPRRTGGGTAGGGVVVGVARGAGVAVVGVPARHAGPSGTTARSWRANQASPAPTSSHAAVAASTPRRSSRRRKKRARATSQGWRRPSRPRTARPGPSAPPSRPRGGPAYRHCGSPTAAGARRALSPGPPGRWPARPPPRAGSSSPAAGPGHERGARGVARPTAASRASRTSAAPDGNVPRSPGGAVEWRSSGSTKARAEAGSGGRSAMPSPARKPAGPRRPGGRVLHQVVVAGHQDRHAPALWARIRRL